VNLLKLDQVMAKTAKSRTAIYAGVKSGVFPKPVTNGTQARPGAKARGVAWVESEIDEFIAAQIAARDAKRAA
jgi:predicted DNA-binding transcriptional regulator AlpA